MEINSITAAQYTAATQNTAAPRQPKNSSELDINDFFRLIAAQLQNQSMYDTVDNTEFLSQLAQFTTLTQLNELKQAINTNLALTLLGKTVTIEDNESSLGVIAGKVEQVSYENGSPYLYVNGKFYPMEKVSLIGE